MYLAERVKKTLMQKEQLIFKNMQKYKQTSLKQNQHLLAKSTETDAKQTIINAKPTPVFVSKTLQNVHRSLRRFICEIIYYNVGPIQQSK